jgi:hypothetical protein
MLGLGLLVLGMCGIKPFDFMISALLVGYQPVAVPGGDELMFAVGTCFEFTE